MADREMYVRCAEMRGDVEFIAGLELREDESQPALSRRLREAVNWQLNPLRLEDTDYKTSALAIENQLKAWWPNRSYFIEVGKENEWVQLFVPFGLPRRDA